MGYFWNIFKLLVLSSIIIWAVISLILLIQMSDSSKKTVHIIGGALNTIAFIASIVIGIRMTNAQKAKLEKDTGDLAIYRAMNQHKANV